MNLNIVNASENDFHAFFLLRSEEKNILWSGHAKPPEEAKLKAWYEEQLRNKKRKIFIGYVGTSPAGYLYLDQQEGGAEEIGYGVSVLHEGKGYGTQFLEFAKQYCYAQGCVAVFGWVAEENVGSVRAFQKAGFKATGRVKEQFFLSLGRSLPFVELEYKPDAEQSINNRGSRS